jgi:hypothetical protein
MTPAKVITNKGKVFFVPVGEEIAGEGREQYFSEEAKKDLVTTSVHGTPNGFYTFDVLRERKQDFYTEVSVRRGSASGPVRNKVPVLKLRDGTRIEPVTEESMEWYQKNIERK